MIVPSFFFFLFRRDSGAFLPSSMNISKTSERETKKMDYSEVCGKNLQAFLARDLSNNELVVMKQAKDSGPPGARKIRKSKVLGFRESLGIWFPKSFGLIFCFESTCKSFPKIILKELIAWWISCLILPDLNLNSFPCFSTFDGFKCSSGSLKWHFRGCACLDQKIHQLLGSAASMPGQKKHIKPGRMDHFRANRMLFSVESSVYHPNHSMFSYNNPYPTAYRFPGAGREDGR